MGHGIAAASTHHPVDGLGLVSLYLFAIGLVLMVTAAGTLSARRRRGYDGTGQVRGQERMAKPQLNLGRVLTVAGAVGFGIWWLALR